jgi:hypothetical protein
MVIEKQKIKMVRTIPVEGEYEVDIYKCDECGKVLNENKYKLIRNHICTKCRVGHYCRDHLLSLYDSNLRNPENEWEPMAIFLCPKCQTKFKSTIERITCIEKEMREKENVVAQLKEELH